MAAIALTIATSPTALAQARAKGSAASNEPNRIVSAEIGENGRLQIRLKSGRRIQPAAEKGQVECEQPAVDAAGHAAGWLVAYEGMSDASYPQATGLTIYRVGKPVRRLGSGLMIVDWSFLDDGAYVRLYSTQAHGPGSDWRVVDTYEVETGRLIMRWVVAANGDAGGETDLADLAGRVTDAAGAAVSDASVALAAETPHIRSGSAELEALVITEDDGAFLIQYLSPGRYELRVEHKGFKPRALPVAIAPHSEKLDIGKVVLERQPTARK